MKQDLAIISGAKLLEETVREDFPILHQEMNGKPLVYLDNGATTQKPRQVISAITNYYENYNSNIHRGVYDLSQKATDAYELGRKTTQKFIGAKYTEEIIFTSGTTDSINLLTFILQGELSKGDEIIVTQMEHHSNIVPWQMLCERSGAVLKVIPIHEDGTLIQKEFKALISDKTKILALAHVSNTMGVVNPIKEMIQLVKPHNTIVVVDGAQAVAHLQVDVQDLDCDFYTFSAHKIYGPTGVGVLYGKKSWLTSLPPYKGGGEMIKEVTFEKTTYNELPHKYEAGTPNIAGVVGLESALDYVNQYSWEEITAHEQAILSYAQQEMRKIDGLRIIGDAKEKIGTISFVVEGTHPSDIGTLLDKMGVAVRTGNHCTQPLMECFNISGTVRASFGIYNTKDEVAIFVKALSRAVEMLK